MSFILDALRKSEHARERRALPGLVDLPVSRAAPSRLPWILGSVGVLLVVNIAVLVWVLARPSPPPAAPPVAAPPVAVPPVAVPPVAVPPVVAPRPGAPIVRRLAAESEPGADPELDHVEAPRPAPRAAPEPYAAERAAAAREFHPGVSVAGLPSIHQLPPQATAGLPVLNIDLHVYSGNPAQRFVIINGQRLHEGGQLKEGPTVDRITQEGAILNHQGTRFLLPRE
jgi:general secretion pathway protein B